MQKSLDLIIVLAVLIAGVVIGLLRMKEAENGQDDDTNE